MGIEPTCPAWKAGALPLSYTRQSPSPEKSVPEKSISKNPIRKRHSFEPDFATPPITVPSFVHRRPLPYLGRTLAGSKYAGGGGGRIRTYVGVRQRVYSPSPLATRAPLRQVSQAHAEVAAIWKLAIESQQRINKRSTITDHASRWRQRVGNVVADVAREYKGLHVRAQATYRGRI